MIKAGIVGLGWWGKTLVEAVGNSDVIRFVSGTTRTMTPEVEAFAKKKGLHLTKEYDGNASYLCVVAGFALDRDGDPGRLRGLEPGSAD